VRQAVECGYLARDEVVERAVVLADHGRHKVGRPRGGGNEFDLGTLSQRLPDPGESGGDNRHPEEGRGTESERLGVEIHVEGENAGGHEFVDPSPDRRLVPVDSLRQLSVGSPAVFSERLDEWPVGVLQCGCRSFDRNLVPSR
jgi:hypothetical protein